MPVCAAGTSYESDSGEPEKAAVCEPGFTDFFIEKNNHNGNSSEEVDVHFFRKKLSPESAEDCISLFYPIVDCAWVANQTNPLRASVLLNVILAHTISF